jgi:DNA-directed RNA polymerase specialized sigma24 family protein
MTTLTELKKSSAAYKTRKEGLRLRKQVRDLVKMGWDQERAEKFVFEDCGLPRNNMLLDCYVMADQAQVSRAKVGRAGAMGNRKQKGSWCKAMKNMFSYMFTKKLPNTGSYREPWFVLVEKFNTLALDPEDVMQDTFFRVVRQYQEARNNPEKTLDKVARQTSKSVFDLASKSCSRRRTFLQGEASRGGCYANPMDVLMRKDEARMKREMLQWYMDDLSLQEEWAVFLTLQGQTQAEVAKFLGMSQQGVGKKLQKLERQGTPLTAYVAR